MFDSWESNVPTEIPGNFKDFPLLGSDSLALCKTFFRIYFLANVNLRSRSLYAIARPYVCPSVCLSVVCSVRAPYLAG